MVTILSDEEVFEQFNKNSLKAYKRPWAQFVEFNSEFDFEAGFPGEEVFTKYFKYLREEKKVASSTLWTTYSYLNSILKRKYSAKLQQFPRLTMLLKGFTEDVKNKAAVFDDARLKEFMVAKMENGYCYRAECGILESSRRSA
jgi:hypothetical protein